MTTANSAILNFEKQNSFYVEKPLVLVMPWNTRTAEKASESSGNSKKLSNDRSTPKRSVKRKSTDTRQNDSAKRRSNEISEKQNSTKQHAEGDQTETENVQERDSQALENSEQGKPNEGAKNCGPGKEQNGRSRSSSVPAVTDRDRVNEGEMTTPKNTRRVSQEKEDGNASSEAYSDSENESRSRRRTKFVQERRKTRSRSRSRSDHRAYDRGGVDLEVHVPEGSDFSSESESDSESSSSSSSSDTASSSDVESDCADDDEEARKLQMLENDPLMVKLMDRMLEKRGFGKNSNANSSSSSRRSKKSKRTKEKRKRREEKRRETKKKRRKEKKEGEDTSRSRRGKAEKAQFKSPKVTKSSEQVKSPSDSMIFRPALKQKRFSKRHGPLVDSEKVISVDQLSQILTNFRVAEKNKTARRDETSSSASETEEPSAKDYADKDVIEAERFKANVAKPNGELPEIFISQGCVPPVDYEAEKGDMKFFAISCHLEDKQVEKIKFGKFMDLNEIRPDKKRGFKNSEEEQKMELIHSNGSTYFAPKKDRGKIDGIKRWNEAFRVYAMVYSRFNPHRAAEIFQYIDTVNSAAASFVWENVAYYDFLFRRLMDENPARSWATKCQELWSESMRDPFSRVSTSRDTNTGSSSKQRSGTCWRFNSRQGCRKSASACRFEHKCSHCGGTSHGHATCRKRPGATETVSGSDRKKSKKDKKAREEEQE